MPFKLDEEPGMRGREKKTKREREREKRVELMFIKQNHESFERVNKNFQNKKRLIFLPQFGMFCFIKHTKKMRMNEIFFLV